MRHSAEGPERHTRFFPLFLSWREPGAARWSFHFLWPFFKAHRRGDAHHSRLFPLYLYWGRSDGRAQYLHFLWPLLRRTRVGDETTFRLLLPYVTYRAKGETHDFRVLWKWIRSTRTEDLSTFRLNPLWRSDRNARGDRYWSILGGLFSRKRTADGVSGRILWLIPY